MRQRRRSTIIWSAEAFTDGTYAVRRLMPAVDNDAFFELFSSSLAQSPELLPRCVRLVAGCKFADVKVAYRAV